MGSAVRVSLLKYVLFCGDELYFAIMLFLDVRLVCFLVFIAARRYLRVRTERPHLHCRSIRDDSSCSRMHG